MSQVVVISDASHALSVLAQLPDKIERRVVSKATRFAANPMLSAARRNAKAAFTARSGLLRKSLTLKKARTPKHITKYYVGPSRKLIGTHKGKKRWPLKYAHLVELGHRIAVGRRGGLSEKGAKLLHKRTRQQYGRRMAVHVGDVAPRPFLTPAFEAARGNVEPRFAEATAKELAKITAEAGAVRTRK